VCKGKAWGRGKGIIVDQSLSIIIAAHNAQATIARQVTDLIEIVTDLTPDFEILVVDDGSTDDTEEIVYELARRYPQVGLARHAAPLGMAEAVRTGMERTRGEVVLVQDGADPVREGDVRQLWQMRHEDDLLIACMQQPRPRDAALLQRLAAWGAKVRQTLEESQRAGLQLIRRPHAAAAGEQLDYELQRMEELRQQPSTASTVGKPKFMSRVRTSPQVLATVPAARRR
jgi:hypothetical protein